MTCSHDEHPHRQIIGEPGIEWTNIPLLDSISARSAWLMAGWLIELAQLGVRLERVGYPSGSITTSPK
jgi:hypothetical protein